MGPPIHRFADVQSQVNLVKASPFSLPDASKEPWEC